MGAVMAGSWAIGFALSSVAYWLLNDSIGWRGLLWVSVLPAPLLCAYIRYFVKEPPVSVENRKRQRDGNQEVRAPLAAIFRRGLRFNTFTACWWMTGHMLIYYSIYGLFATWLQSELRVPAAAVATPVLLNNLVVFGAAFVWGAITDRIGRRVTIIIQALSGCVVAPLYLLSGNLNVILVGFVAQGFFGASVTLMAAAYMPERFPTARHGERLLLPFRAVLRRPGSRRRVLFRGRAAYGLRRADADWLPHWSCHRGQRFAAEP